MPIRKMKRLLPQSAYKIITDQKQFLHSSLQMEKLDTFGVKSKTTPHPTGPAVFAQQVKGMHPSF